MLQMVGGFSESWSDVVNAVLIWAAWVVLDGVDGWGPLLGLAVGCEDGDLVPWVGHVLALIVVGCE